MAPNCWIGGFIPAALEELCRNSKLKGAHSDTVLLVDLRHSSQAGVKWLPEKGGLIGTNDVPVRPTHLHSASISLILKNPRGPTQASLRPHLLHHALQHLWCLRLPTTFSPHTRTCVWKLTLEKALLRTFSLRMTTNLKRIL